MTRIIATYAVRDEPQWLVDDLRSNLAPWVDEFAEIDNRGQTGGWGHEGQLRTRQRLACRDLDGDWVLYVDPDERIEDRAAQLVRPALAARPRAVHGFPLCEMWTPTGYRVDGGWAAKKPRRRLIPLRWGQQYPNKPIHCGLAPVDVALPRVTLDVRLYHLKSIEPTNRVARAQAYLAADPEFRYQRREGKDWDWLHDETGLQVAEIEPGRGFTPPYTRPYLFTPPGTAPATTGPDIRSWA